MKKLKLELDELKVESFDTASAPAASRGTVQGNEDCCCCCCYPCCCQTNQASCYGSCDTCYESCNGSCNTCVASCNGSCNTCYDSCYGTCGEYSCYGSCDYYCEPTYGGGYPRYRCYDQPQPLM